MRSLHGAGKWLAGGVAVSAVILAGVAILAFADRESAVPSPPAQALTPAERNLAVFDAASELIEQHYFDQEMPSSEAWKNYKAEWRDRIRELDPAVLYLNGLDIFATGLPSSHVVFEPPALASPPAQSASPATPPAGAIDMAELRELIASGPGFDAVYIRRGGRTQYVVGELRNESPAERAGIAPGWMIMNTSLNATPAGARFSASILPLDEAGIRAADTTGFPPAVLSQNQLDEFARTRAVQFEFALRRLSAREVFEERRLGDITYVRFDGFDGAGGAAKALEAIDRAGPAGLIIDLRYNRGGRGLEMSQVLAKLLGSGVVVGHQASRTGDKIPVKSLGLGSPYEGPAVLLIGPATASAAEITAAAVQDHERGKLIGRRTNGSVVSASKFDLPDGGRIMIPVQDFRRLDSRRIEGFGVEPDIWMLPSLDDVRQGRDPLLERALVEMTMTRKKL